MALPPQFATLPSTRAELDVVAARVLVGAVAIAGGLVILTAVFSELAGSASLFSRLRGAYGAVLLAAAGIGHWQARRGHPRRASSAVLLAALLAAWAHASITGLGLHALILTGALLAV